MSIKSSVTMLVIAMLLSACTQLSYYSQSIHGHYQLVSQRQSIDALLATSEASENNSSLPAHRQAQLKQLVKIREFAYKDLHLPDNGSYRQYVELDRAAVTWNVIATPAYSMQPKQWCFPVVGCLSYKGYFSQSAAIQEATLLEKQGYDVYVSESTAYSTLGWFKDPVVSTMLDHGILLAAETLFHELAHQRLYMPNDTAFNEAFATAVAQEGVKRWLQTHSPEQLNNYVVFLQKKRDFILLLSNTANRLARVYQQDVSDQEKLQAKQTELLLLEEKYRELKQQWQGDGRYDAWFDKPVNNARLALVGVYYDKVDRFVTLLNEQSGDFDGLYQNAAELGIGGW